MQYLTSSSFAKRQHLRYNAQIQTEDNGWMPEQNREEKKQMEVLTESADRAVSDDG